MNAEHKKIVLRMIPYGIYVLTSDDGKGNISAATVNWVTQTAFAPPLLVVGVKTEFRDLSNSESSANLCPKYAGQRSKKSSFHLLQTGRCRQRQAQRAIFPKRHNWRTHLS